MFTTVVASLSSKGLLGFMELWNDEQYSISQNSEDHGILLLALSYGADK